MEPRNDFWWSSTLFPPKWLDIHNLRLRIAPSLVQNTPCLNQFEAALEFGIWVALHCRPKCIMHSLLKAQCQLWIHWCSLWNNFDLARVCLDNDFVQVCLVSDYKNDGESTLLLPDCGAPCAIRTLLFIGVGTISEEIQAVFLAFFVPVT